MTARILVVDDTLPNVKLLSAKLINEYYDVITAYSGPEALEKVVAEKPDLILLDVMMPGMSGFEVCERIKSDIKTAHIPVVMVTALSELSDRVKGLEAGADDFLSKPINDTALFARVRSLLRLKMVLDEWRLREKTSDELGVVQANSLDEAQIIQGAKIVIVDDLPVEAERLSQFLKDEGYNTEIMTSAESVMGLMNAPDACDLIVISLTIAGTDGLRLTSHLRSQERTRGIPVLLIDDNNDIKRVAKGLDLGANDYLLRPYDKSELRARVRTLLKRKLFQDKLRSNYETSLSLAVVDPMTGLFNRRYLEAHFPKLLEKARQEESRVLGVMVIDIDKFKSINDTYGHPVGDEVIKELGRRLSRAMRPSDLVARFGGEEFVILIPDTRPELLTQMAERVRTAIAGTPFVIEQNTKTLDVTISLGVTAAGSQQKTLIPDGILKVADDALYEAKHGGRNKWVFNPLPIE